MKKMNKKGFTLIELLAVIIILGVLMIIAIPSVTNYIQNSRKSAYVDSAAAYIDAVRTKVNEGKDLRLFSTSTLYMIPVGNVAYSTAAAEQGKTVPASCVTVESGGQSPFSDKWNYAYVGVTYDGKGYNYFFIGEDGASQGLAMLTQEELTKEGTDKIYSSYGTESAPVVEATSTMLTTLYSNRTNVTKVADNGDADTPEEFNDDAAEASVLAKGLGSRTKVIYIGTCKHTEEVTAG